MPSVPSGTSKPVGIAMNLGFVRRVGVGEDLTMTGGGSRDPGVVDAVSKELGIPVRVALHPQAVGALGAALIAYDKIKK